MTKTLEQQANRIRKSIVHSIYCAQSGHPGGSLSAADILTTLYFDELNVDVADEKANNRDRFVLSKGHSAPALYSTLAHRGFFNIEKLDTLRALGSVLQGHPDMKHIKGVDMSTGSLGQGISAAAGMALAAKLKKSDYRVYALLGDGELQEGQVWEASMFSAHQKLDNLCIIIDNNNLQIDGCIDEVCSPYPIDQKFEAFGFHVITVDGHDIKALQKAFEVARQIKDKPTAIVANTTKGKGVSFMENLANWHGAAPNKAQYEQAMLELDAAYEQLGGENNVD